MKEIKDCENKNEEPIEEQNVVDIHMTLDEDNRITLIMQFDKNHIGALDDLLEWLTDLGLKKFSEPY